MSYKDMLGEAVQKLTELPRNALEVVCDILKKKAEDPEWVPATKRFLRKENPWLAPVLREWKVWKTVKIGTGLCTAGDFRKAFTEAGCRVSDWADDMLGRPAFTTGGTEEEVELVVASVAELGFKEGVRLRDIYERAASLGLGLCPAEVGPQLRLQYKDQSEGDWLRVAMEPITDSDGFLGVFSLDRYEGGLWISGRGGHPGIFWDPGVRWVFVRRK